MRAHEFINTPVKREDILSRVLNPALVTLRQVFQKHGKDIRIVGGAVRDIMSGKTPKDIDLATDATPDEQIEIYKSSGYRYVETGLAHGTITVVIDKEPYEITSLRTETNHDGRHATVAYTTDWGADLSRRDLTINAMALTFDGELIDPFGGERDLKSKTVRFVGNPVDRMTEDYLRILRFFRFHGRIGNKSFDPQVEAAIHKAAPGLSKISGERIWSEMSKIITGPNVAVELAEMNKLGILQIIGLPKVGDKIASMAAHLSLVNAPITVLAYLIDNQQTAEALVNHWKLSGAERDLLYWLVKNKNNPLNLEVAQNMVADNIPSTYVFELASLQRKQSIATAMQSFQKPIFPVSGNDLQVAGVKPGIGMGKVIKDLRDIWKQSRFKLSKDELLAHLPKEDDSNVRSDFT